jgi:hypothetical protein
MTKDNSFMQITITEEDIRRAVGQYLHNIIVVREGHVVGIELVASTNGFTALANIHPGVLAQMVPLAAVATMKSPATYSATLTSGQESVTLTAPLAEALSVEDRLTAKFGPGPSRPGLKSVAVVAEAPAEVIATPDPVVVPWKEPTIPVTTLFNKKIPSTPAEARAAMQAEVAAEEAEEIAETPAAVIAEVVAAPVEVVVAAVAEEVRKPTSLFKNLRKPVNA